MGLDIGLCTMFTKTMTLLPQRGLGHLVSNILGTLGWGKKVRSSPLDKERQSYEHNVRRQFEELKKKGISIPVFTL